MPPKRPRPSTATGRSSRRSSPSTKTGCRPSSCSRSPRWRRTGTTRARSSSATTVFTTSSPPLRPGTRPHTLGERRRLHEHRGHPEESELRRRQGASRSDRWAHRGGGVAATGHHLRAGRRRRPEVRRVLVDRGHLHRVGLRVLVASGQRSDERDITAGVQFAGIHRPGEPDRPFRGLVPARRPGRRVPDPDRGAETRRSDPLHLRVGHPRVPFGRSNTHRDRPARQRARSQGSGQRAAVGAQTYLSHAVPRRCAQLPRADHQHRDHRAGHRAAPAGETLRAAATRPVGDADHRGPDRLCGRLVDRRSHRQDRGDPDRENSAEPAAAAYPVRATR